MAALLSLHHTIRINYQEDRYMKFRKTAAGLLAAVITAGCVCSIPAETNPFVIVSAAAKKLSAPEITKSEADETSITLEWEEVEGADGYVLYRYSAAKKTYIATDSFAYPEYILENLEPGTVYRLKVAAYIDKNGKKAAQKQSKMIKISTAKLSGPSEISASASSDSVKLSWDSVYGIDAYRVYLYNEASGEFVKYKTVLKPECIVTGLKNETKYTFRIDSVIKKGSAYKAQGSSETFSVTTNKPAELKVPDFYIKEADGKEHKLSHFAGKPIVIFFFEYDEVNIERDISCLHSLYKKYGDQINFIPINCNNKSLLKYVKKFIEDQKLTFTVYYDWDLSALDKQEKTVVPYFMAINKNGELIKTYGGGIYNAVMIEYTEKLLE